MERTSKGSFANVAETVLHDLDNARDNGAFEMSGPLYGLSVEEIAEDLQACSADCEALTVEAMKPHIEIWLARHGLAVWSR